MTVYVYDLDGTLTPPRLPMTEAFAQRFWPWLKQNKVFIASGSDFEKVTEQLPQDMYADFSGLYCSMGNELFRKDEKIYTKDFNLNPVLLSCLESYRKKTAYPYQLFDNYIEQRTGMLNFSVIGRDCPYAEREKYFAWDLENQEREKIKQELSALFPEYDFSVGGMISMDIVQKGCGKGQIALHLRQQFPEEEIIFFGDKTFEGGNDYELACQLNKMDNTRVIQIDQYEHVLDILEI